MNAVVEIDKIRQVIYTLPLDRLTGPPARPHRLQIRAIGEDL